MDDHGVEVGAKVDAKKETIRAEEGLALALRTSRVYAVQGKKRLQFECRGGKLVGEEGNESLRKAIIGPSGNLRAPTLWVGKSLVVGFEPDMYAEVLS